MTITGSAIAGDAIDDTDAITMIEQRLTENDLSICVLPFAVGLNCPFAAQTLHYAHSEGHGRNEIVTPLYKYV